MSTVDDHLLREVLEFAISEVKAGNSLGVFLKQTQNRIFVVVEVTFHLEHGIEEAHAGLESTQDRELSPTTYWPQHRNVVESAWNCSSHCDKNMHSFVAALNSCDFLVVFDLQIVCAKLFVLNELLT